MLWRFRSRPRSRGSTCGHTGYTVWPLSALCHSRAADQRLLRIENLPEGHFTQLGHNGRWPNALNRAAILRLPAVQPEEVANGGFPIWRMPTPCP